MTSSKVMVAEIDLLHLSVFMKLFTLPLLCCLPCRPIEPVRPRAASSLDRLRSVLSAAMGIMNQSLR
jgi:hypothetical protein